MECAESCRNNLIAKLIDFVVQFNFFTLGRNRRRAMDGTTKKTPQALENNQHGIFCSSRTAIGPSNPFCKFLGLRADAEPFEMRRDDRHGRLLRTADFPDYDWSTIIFALVLFGLLPYKIMYELDIAL
jgi:hypothetical protein